MNLCVDRVTVGYNDGPSIVKNVSFDAQPGKVTTLLGPNGCGKSTLLKTLSRLLAPTEGRVRVEDKDVHSLGAREAAQLIALLPQHPLCPAGLTVGELVERGRHPYRRTLWGGGVSASEDKKKVSEALEKTATANLVTRDVSELSGGQRQRVWMAMVLAQDTPIVLLDEPTTYLDPAHAMEILGIVRELALQGKTVVTVLHDLGLAGAFSDEMIVMKEGKKIAEGAPKEALTVDVLREAYGLNAEVWEDPRGTAPVIVPRGIVANPPQGS
ncbi:ABC transporter ATP-binding protein [uncultured Corynebacterium sp.]|uniref:ABC transporter ATP-binding protein n=1 Tax=uncultured Corynebacterium sp. TaxID=159447 RepID=UPI0025E81900|nr:ABC transporter ATP-binding protein [uncultured Corynebacterium sp.]